MGIFKKKSNTEYDKKKRKQEKEQEKFNQRQEELDNMYKKEKQKSDFKFLLSELKLETYTKRIVAVIVFVCLIDLQLSYVLAFMDKVQIAETLSTQICLTVLGTVIVYLIRAYFDTKAEKRDEMIKQGYILPKDSSVVPGEVIKSKIEEVLANTGVAEHFTSDLETENPDDSDDEICC